MGGFRAESASMTTTLTDLRNDPNSLCALLTAHRREKPGEPLLILQKSLAVSHAVETALRSVLDSILANSPGAVALTVMSNAATEFNPYAGLHRTSQQKLPTRVLEQLVALLGEGELAEWSSWPPHLLLLSSEAIDILAEDGAGTADAVKRLKKAGGHFFIPDSIFLYHPDKPLFEESALDPHEERKPAPWGRLRSKLDAWISIGGAPTQWPWIRDLAAFGKADLPTTLHITHSWGGGVERWVDSFIEADTDGVNFQLCSEGPQTGEGYGQRFSLFLGNQKTAPVASWWIQPVITSSAVTHDQYKAMLDRIADRYGIGRIIISSLVGHSLDALNTDIPTLQILHDFYPRWPLLGVDPTPFLGEGGSALESALEKHRLLPGFRDRTADSWKEIAQEWRGLVSRREIRVAAPSQSVIDMIRSLDEGWSGTDIQLIPHGLPPSGETVEVLPRERKDGRLRVVIPGRIQQGKGKRLLLASLPSLAEFAQVYLVGAGKEGEAFFGLSGVNVIPQYQREELPGLLATIGPHVAALLSTVPETFSYTLSEMQQLNIPVIATRLGSFAERINDGDTGWLIEPEPAALVNRVRALASDRDAIDKARHRLLHLEHSDTVQMVRQYQGICEASTRGEAVFRVLGLDGVQNSALAFQATSLGHENRELMQQATTLQSEVEKRSEWAEERELALQQEVRRRKKWVADLEGRLDETVSTLQQTEEKLEHEQAVHRQTNIQLEKLTAVHEWVLSTASWRLTKPFRVVGRILENLGNARAWNPLRWPLLLSQAVRTISTEGLSGALERSQSTRQQHQPPESIESVTIEEIGDPAPPAEFPVIPNPDVSVVIPVYNQWKYTAACLRSLAETRSHATFEVIVVDDHSSDETASWMNEVEGVTYLRNEKNLGFIGSCNHGAEAARGRFIVMLNNDTQVVDGWLDALIETFRHYPDTGIAGSSLVYPDGKLQEAGGIIFNDASGWNYGKGDHADRPEYHYIREVDYCSGACIMLENSLFRKLGGFDTHFTPAYYEDTDLAFRVRAKGLKVRVQPAAVVIHHEGVTSGTDLDQGVKQYQVVNREKFRERWKDELEHYPDPVIDPDDGAGIRKARDHRLKGRILVIDAYTPEPDQDSGSVRLCYLMGCMTRLEYGVTFMADNRSHAGSYTASLQQAGIEVIYSPWADSLQQFFTERGADFDFVMISRHYIASNYLSLLKRHCPQAKFIFDTVDLHYLREERMAELENSLPLKRTAAQTRRSELAVIESADATIVVSPAEKTVLGEAAPGAAVHVISNVHEVTGSQRSFEQRKDIFFVGGYQHPPNIDAAQWFVSEIWPLVRQQLPDIEFHLIGSKAPEQIRALNGNGVRFHGFVKTLEPWLDGCRMAVAPLRYGAGIKGKVNMSMARGQPVVATPMAVEGMFAKAGHDVLVAESAEDFAAEIVRLYRDEALWNRVSEAGLENVRRYFSVETATLGLQQLFNSLGEASAPR
jgi:GT2 family glycosyltransferase